MRNFYLAAFLVVLLSSVTLAQNETTTTQATTTVATTSVATTTVATTTTAPATTTAATTTTATTVPPATTTAGATTTSILTVSCTDSDGGKNYDVKGTVTQYRSGVQVYTDTDYCSSDLLVLERSCLEDGGTAGQTYFCPNGCKDGACLSGPATTTVPGTTTVPATTIPPNVTTTIPQTTTAPITTECSNTQCGPVPGTPNYLCPDGKTYAGPTGKCLRQPSGACGWEIISCPSATTTTQLTCPSPPSPPSCPSPNYLQKRFDNQGCVTGYECVSSKPVCPSSPSPPGCPANSRLNVRVDNNGCVSGYDCVASTAGEPPREDKCPSQREPVCGTDQNTYYNSCDAHRAKVSIAYNGECGSVQKPFCGNNKCDIGEDQNNCPNDCGRPIPQGCRVEKDPNGFERFFCEGEFKPVCHDIKYDVDKCYSAGGEPRKNIDPAGCTTVQCEFGQQRPTNPVFGHSQCSTDKEVNEIEKKCKSVGLPMQISFAGEGCKQARCGQKEERSTCKELSSEERKGVEESCFSKGGQPVKDFDQNGCLLLRCSDTTACQRDVPKNAYGKCQSEGGELVVNRDDRGCVQFVDCIHRGDENEIYVEDIDEVPETTELLDIAFKLEELRIALDKLAKQTEDIATYYKSTGSDEEERFKRVADMFEAARDKVSEIKDNLRSHLNSITVDDVLEVKHDVRYIKDVMLKDIVYFMLSSGDEIKELKASAKNTSAKDVKNCGTNGACFDRAFRACQKVTFTPEGKQGPVIELRGLEGGACVLYASMDEEFGPPPGFIQGVNPPYEMTCRIKNYARGIRGPEDILPECTGSMVELVKQFGPGSEGPNQRRGPPGVEGLCSGEECAFICPQSAENAKKCLKELGSFMQPEQRAGLEKIASGEFQPPRGFRGSSVGTQQGSRGFPPPSGGFGPEQGGFGSQQGVTPSSGRGFPPPQGDFGQQPPPPSGGFNPQPVRP